MVLIDSTQVRQGDTDALVDLLNTHSYDVVDFGTTHLIVLARDNTLAQKVSNMKVIDNPVHLQTDSWWKDNATAQWDRY